MPTLEKTDFNLVCATLGGFISIFGLVSYLMKEKFYLSEALISMLAGITVSPHAANLIRPLEYAQGVEANIDTITLYFSRLVLGVQLVLAGVQLPSRYLQLEWKSLSLLLGPGMTIMWIVSSLICWAMVPHINILQALALGACVTPTDPVLSNSIVKGKFADKNIPPNLQKIIIAESGANDGLGYPFLFLALYLLKYNGQNGAPGAGEAMRLWFGETWAYTILLSVVYGAATGWVAKELLHYAERKRFVDRESFLVFAISLALFVIGTCGMIGSDDVLACFVAGNAFTWDDWFRVETEDDSLQPTIDMLLNISIFMWYGAVCPWKSFRVNNIIPIWRLIFLGVLILLLRRLPMILAGRKLIHQIEGWKQAAFAGFFGPIGVSAIFYLYISLQFLDGVTEGGVIRNDAAHLQDTMRVVIWFLAICSIVVHGLSVPLGKLGLNIPRTLSRALSSDRESDDHVAHLHPLASIGHETRPDLGVQKPKRISTEPKSFKGSRSKLRGEEPPMAPIFKLRSKSSAPAAPARKLSQRSNATQHTDDGDIIRPVHIIEDPGEDSTTNIAASQPHSLSKIGDSSTSLGTRHSSQNDELTQTGQGAGDTGTDSNPSV